MKAKEIQNSRFYGFFYWRNGTNGKVKDIYKTYRLEAMRPLENKNTTSGLIIKQYQLTLPICY
ncbi:hypothetical protein P872_17625 [Rhodonellum psychrophilum GCM71 = DSM 17998]|uniref:Uncharacterized protein n=1 Tax=Rhodonellum psychrophilum GCM71 = DSM 17998 TaxID=1123057 RepID=U5C2L7_9BACT|nr:hypothetical protein P872_17625 [Rhodonellum psychrophilum GCM71 = DSM 17998]